MKRIFTFWLTSIICISAGAQNFKVTLQAPQYKSGIAYLTYHMGKNLNVEDSAGVNSNGVAIFTGKRKLPGGIYAVVLPGKRITVDFFTDKEQVISIKIDTNDLVNKTVVTGSKENILFQQYQQYIAVKGKLLEAERQAYLQATTKKDSALHEANYLKYNKELKDYRENIILNHPKSMMAVLLNAMKEPKLLGNRMVTRNDSLQNYYYYKAHYWDGITFMDDRILRTPFFLPKFEKYYREILVQQADSIIKEADYQLLLARSSPEIYKFLLNWLTDEYINPKYMGQDAVFVHLFEKYHSKGLTSWLNEKQMETISRRAYMLMANLIGLKAAELDMLDTTGKPSPLYQVKADYTVVCFWDPTCGHCKEELPRLDSIYRSSWKDHGVKIYAVLSADSKEDLKNEWLKYIREHHIGDWTNVYQTKEMEAATAAAQKPGYRQLYDITLTPTLYLLDSEKRIIGKKLTWQQLDELLHVKWGSKTN
ncbi:MAG: alkyl hydroperoxide reductase/Thiol specific antioxidant/Mal allergen [Ferruginibacter sp.]|nr:alkyl hydroperoxide reductase/Thiol specific antioxidant/Mal allergen [Ferruginibacter sp.]